MSQRVPQAPSTEAAPPAVDPSAHAVGMLAFGAAGMRVVRRWVQQVPPSTPVTWAAAQRADTVSLAELERMVRAAPAGWGLMLAGPADDVRAAREAALGLGMADAEIRVALTGADLRRVWCPHCAATTDTDVLPGDTVHCGGCTVPLRVPASTSRTLGAHVGVAADPAHHVA
ncbi:dimethylamine monooxygenase subunit DmmA family protein [Trujillonella humicola]|uniref:dimethylamine monooxygenase subunit DmmA family protein n=1 Tax=Trujillonella humicola TaxID=3383699 RepID=UPI0039062BC1